MTTENINQLTLFAAPPLPAEYTSADLKPADVQSADPKSGDKIISGSELMEFVRKHQERMWRNPKTRQNTITRVQRFDSFGDHNQLKIADITAVHIYDWLDDEKQRGLSDASINRYGSAMSAVLTFAVELKLRHDSPKLRYTKEFARERYMTDREIDRLISHFLERGDQWMADLCFVGANTGMRLGEILSLGIVRCGHNSHWGEATIHEDSVHLPAHITKTRDGRWVSINANVREACVRLSESIGKHFTHRKFYDRWNDARERIAPGDKDFVFHCLRHTCASRMANDLQMNSLLIAQQLGHKSLSTTDKYVHAKPETRAAFSAQMSMGSGAMQNTN